MNVIDQILELNREPKVGDVYRITAARSNIIQAHIKRIGSLLTVISTKDKPNCSKHDKRCCDKLSKTKCVRFNSTEDDSLKGAWSCYYEFEFVRSE